jgi:competence protein ComEC
VTPLSRVTLAFAAGLLAGLRLPIDRPLLALSLAGALVLIATAVRVANARMIFATFAALGTIAGAIRAETTRSDCRATLRDGAALTLRGWYESIPRDGAAAFRAHAVSVQGRPVACAGTFRVRPPAGSTPRPGREAEVGGRWWAMPAQGDGWPTPPQRLGTVAARNTSLVQNGRSAPLLLMRGAAQARLRAVFEERPGAYAEALVLAQRDGLDEEVRLSFAKAGLSHLLAISGTHVALVAGGLLLMVRIARLPAASGAAVAGGGTVAYVLLLGAPNAAARAALQVLLLLAGRRAQRPSNPFTLMAAAALVLLAREPLSILDAGFQLSFAGVFGLLAFRGPIRAPLAKRMPGSWADALATSLAATATTLPIAALHFGMISFIGIVANLVAIPTVAVAVPAVALTLGAGAASLDAGRFLAAGAAVPIGILDRIAALAAAVPGGHAYAGGTMILLWLAGAAAWILVARHTLSDANTTRKRATRMRRIAVLAGGAACLTTLIVVPLIGRRGTGDLEIHAIDVGQGDAFAVRTPAGRWLLIDTGPRSDGYDAGRRRVVPFLLSRGVTRIDALILTHPDADHIGGADAVLESFDVGAVIDPALPAGKDMYIETLRRARGRRAPWYAGRAGRELVIDDVVLRFLAPEEDALDASMGANDFSVVFRLAYGRFGALFLGDAPTAVENALVRVHGDALAADVLKVGHHGSRTSTSDSLLAVVRPRVALVSAGARNRYGHPDPTVIDRLGRNGVLVLRTDRQGSLRVRVDGAGRVRLTTER